MSDSASNDGIDFSGTFGPIYWGFVVSLFLGGVTVVQAYMYFPQSRDRLSLQLIAAVMLVLDLASSGLVAQSIYYYLLPNFGSLLPLGSVTPELSAECLLSTIITLISQMYFVHQLYVVKHLGKTTWLLIGTIATSAFLAFAGGIACVSAMYIFRHGVLSNRNTTFVIFFGIAKGFGALTDIMATIAMSMFLNASRTGIADTNKILKTLIRFVVQRGALVTLIQTLLLITFFALPHSLVWFAFHVNVTKLYANTFFAMLNGRDHIKRQSTFNSSLSFKNTSYTDRVRYNNADEHPSYNLRNLEAQNPVDSKPFDMPTVTKTIVIADL